MYKIKKAVKFPFLDFSTLELRKHFCDEEVRLNRRTQPEMYLGVVAVVKRHPKGKDSEDVSSTTDDLVELIDADEKSLGGDTVLDYAVKVCCFIISIPWQFRKVMQTLLLNVTPRILF